MPEDYRKVVLDYYLLKVNDGSIAPSLLDPTPGSFRERCIYVYKERCSGDDDEIIKSFFASTDKECLSLLENSFAVKFRQLPKILKGRVDNPSIKYIELIAWLIDFKPRPSTTYYKSFYAIADPNIEVQSHEVVEQDKELQQGLLEGSSTIEETALEDENILEDGYIEISKEGEVQKNGNNNQFSELKTAVSGSDDKSSNSFIDKLKEILLVRNTMKVLATAAITALSFGIYYFIVNNNQCMYWKVDRYEAIGCKIKVDAASIIALDQQKVDHLKKITRLDTIGEKDLGKVWYVKIKVDSAEFYTDSGEYPLDTRKRLRPASKLIIEKYVLSKRLNKMKQSEKEPKEEVVSK